MDPSTPEPWTLSDEQLLRECRFEAYTASGPGGQKRNKTQAAVRITHLPSGVSATAAESRSQRENRIHALRRLRHKLALEGGRAQEANELIHYRPPAWFSEYPGLHINPKNPRYPQAVSEVLAVLKGMHWSVGRAAVMLGITSSALIRFLHDDPALWTRVSAARRELGMTPLRAR